MLLFNLYRGFIDIVTLCSLRHGLTSVRQPGNNRPLFCPSMGLSSSADLRPGQGSYARPSGPAERGSTLDH